MSDLQKRLFADMADTAQIDRAAAAARAHVGAALGRRAYPDAADIDALDELDGPLGAGTETNAILDEMEAILRPATAEMLGGRYFGFVNGGVIPAALSAKIMASAWDQNAALAVMSPAAAKLETIVEGWLNDIFGLPEEAACGFVSGSSMAIFCGLAAGRWRLLQQSGWDVNARGLMGAPKLRVVAGREAHSAVLKALRLLGIGTDCIEWVPCDEQGRMIAEEAPMLDGRTLVLLQAGHVASGAFDPMEALIAEARRVGAWVHVDGAFGLWAAASPRLKHLTKGMARAHSLSADCHKTLNAPYDSGLVMATDGEALRQALSAAASYLPVGEGP
ncbi:MAG: aminotransferase class V-fold PLP-dependent enzyme, partial [Pseudomonadota bacterium]